MNPIFAKRYFAFHRLFLMIADQLPTDEQKLRFYKAVCLYGFEKEEPDFSDDERLQKAWALALPDLSFNWGQTETGRNGGIVSAKVRAKTRKPKEPKEESKEEAETILEPFPKDEEPKEIFVSFMVSNELDLLVKGSRPLCGPQFRWLLNNCGTKVTTAICRYFQRCAYMNGGVEYVEEITKERSIGKWLLKAHEEAKASFNKWLFEDFPKVADMPHKLTFAQYYTLRRKYGRANVLKKLAQLNEKKYIYKNARAFEILENWINKSIECTKGSRYWLPFFDDCPENAYKSPNFDINFDFGVEWRHIEKDGKPLEEKTPL